MGEQPTHALRFLNTCVKALNVLEISCPAHLDDMEPLDVHAFLVVETGAQHLRKDLELGAYFRALELGCRTGVPREIGTPVPTRTSDLKGNLSLSRCILLRKSQSACARSAT